MAQAQKTIDEYIEREVQRAKDGDPTFWANLNFDTFKNLYNATRRLIDPDVDRAINPSRVLYLYREWFYNQPNEVKEQLSINPLATNLNNFLDYLTEKKIIYTKEEYEDLKRREKEKRSLREEETPLEQTKKKPKPSQISTSETPSSEPIEIDEPLQPPSIQERQKPPPSPFYSGNTKPKRMSQQAPMSVEPTSVSGEEVYKAVRRRKRKEPTRVLSRWQKFLKNYIARFKKLSGQSRIRAGELGGIIKKASEEYNAQFPPEQRKTLRQIRRETSGRPLSAWQQTVKEYIKKYKDKTGGKISRRAFANIVSYLGKKWNKNEKKLTRGTADEFMRTDFGRGFFGGGDISGGGPSYYSPMKGSAMFY
jgi:transposase